MYAQIKNIKKTKNAGQVVWVECTQDEFDDLNYDSSVIILLPDNTRATICKECLEYLSDNENEAHAMVANSRVEKIAAIEGTIFGIMYHNYEDLGYAWFYGVKFINHEEVGKAARYVRELYCNFDRMYPDCDASLIGDFLNEEGIPILHVGRMIGTDNLYYWVSTRENAFTSGGVIKNPQRVEFYVLLDQALQIAGL